MKTNSLFITVLAGVLFVAAGCGSNEAPVIVSVNQTQVGDSLYYSIRFEAEVYDPEGDSLLLEWGFPGGVVEGDTNAFSVVWRPPVAYEELRYIVNLRVTDGESGAFSPVYVTVKALRYVQDPRDGQVYPVLKMGSQIWFGMNANFNPGSGTWCYNNDEAYCFEFGRLYSFEKASQACMPGWHLPDLDEWVILLTYVGEDPGLKLKSTSGWNENGNGTDAYGFNVIPAGRTYIDLSFGHMKRHTHFWTATEDDWLNARSWRIDYYGDGVYPFVEPKGSGFSVRCIKE